MKNKNLSLFEKKFNKLLIQLLEITLTKTKGGKKKNEDNKKRKSRI